MSIYDLTCSVFLLWLIIQIIKETVSGIIWLLRVSIVYLNDIYKADDKN